MNTKIIKAHMEAAYAYARASTCVKRKVGSIIVDGDCTVSIGYNGTPPGSDNVCEIDGRTRPDVIHAEDNALRKLNHIAPGMALFVTTAPCERCAELIKTAGIREVFYHDTYKNSIGLEYLNDHNIPTHKVDLN